MKKNAVNTIFVDEYKRRKKIIAYSCVIAVFLMLFILFACTYFIKNKKQYIGYTENSDISYKVYLKKNEFFDKNYAEERKQYIASLIDYINTTFKYTINVEKDNVDFKYFYKIDAEVDVRERNSNNSLYNFKEIVVDTKEGTSKGSSNISILENVNIDYNHYNDLIKKFIRIYRLDDTVSTLKLSLHVIAASSCVDFEKEENTESVVSLVIPLTTKTMAIDITDDLVNNHYNIIVCNDKHIAIIYLLLSIVMLIITVVIIIKLSKYISSTRSPKDVYERELKKILSNYHSFIQKVNGYFDLSHYKLVPIDSFTDMLEIRDTVDQPILMVENEEKSGVHFIIPSNTKLLYTYSLKVADSKEEKKKKNNKDNK